jgi:hypothetical protein
MTPSRLLVGLFMILNIGSCTSVPYQGDLTARAVAQAWLALVDSGQYGKAYDQYAARIKIAVSRERAISSWAGRRGPLGPVVSRQIVSSVFTHTLKGAPDGTYEILHYRTSFQRKANAWEEVVVTKESGNWEVSGYHFK